MGKFLDNFNSKLLITDKSVYYREQYQSYMTGPEWRNVEMAEEFARFLAEGNSMFNFPYFSQVFDLWRITWRSFNAARKYDPAWKIVNSEYMLMDLFVPFFTTLELVPKGIVAFFLRPFLNKNNKSTMQTAIAGFFAKYASDLQTIPFYDQDYKKHKTELAAVYRDASDKTWVDWFSWKLLSMDLTARRWISAPLSYWFHQDGNIVPPSTDILVRYRAKGASDTDVALTSFKSKLPAGAEIVIDNNAEQVYSKPKKAERDYISIYARLRVPRYAAFQAVLAGFTAEGIDLKKIAGQDHVQVKCVVEAKESASLQENQQALEITNNAVPLYHYGDRVHANRRVCLFDVPVKQLQSTVKEMSRQEGVEVQFIHNF